jgi:undecaprenyl phosphate-alpha-L-ara4FN deformylase
MAYVRRPKLALKIDVDTERGTRIGVPNLLADLRAIGAPASFLFSLGPDNTGRAITRVFRPGFFQKVSRTNVVQLYGIRTLLNGTLLPAPHIGRKHAGIMQQVRRAGFEVGIHCYDHYRWQDHVLHMSLDQVRSEFAKARTEFIRIFDANPLTAGAAGWQANEISLQVYDEARLLYASDTRGVTPFFPRINGRVFKTLQIPSTLPTFDELLGRPEFPEDKIVPHYVSLLSRDRPNVFTLHAEIEGMGKRPLFQAFLRAMKTAGVEFVRPEELAHELLDRASELPVCDMIMAPVDGRSGLVATQAA